LGYITLFVFKGLTAQSVVELIIVGVLLVISSLIAAMEVSFFSLGPTQIEELKSIGKPSSLKIIELLDNPKKLIATVVMSHNLVNIGVVIISEMLFLQLLDFTTNPLMGFIIKVIVVTFIILLVGEVIPKIYAAKKPLAIALKMVYPLVYLQKALTPFIYILVQSTSLIDKRVKQKAHTLSIDDLSQALELTSNEHTPEQERKILQGIVEFGNTEVRQIMKPRIDVVAFDQEASFEDIISLINKNGFSRVPVYRDTLDNVIGVLYVKDLIAHLHQNNEFKWQFLLRPAFFVPEGKKIDDLMKEFQAKKNHLAIVVDEYGGTNGIVTLEDIIEEIVGEINDEFDDDELVYSKLDDNNYVFEAKIPLNDLYRVLNIDGEEFEEKKGESDTLAGFILELSKKIPLKNEKIPFNNYVFTIESVDKRRINRIKVTMTNKIEGESNHLGKILGGFILPFIFVFSLLLSSCESEFTPKPRGYFRIDLPEKKYQSFKNNCPFYFDYPTYAEVVPYQGPKPETCWYNINFPKYRATLYLSFVEISDKTHLVKELEDARTLVYKHTIKADAIDEIPVIFNERKVYGLCYDIEGNSASQYQFYLTDSVSKFMRGALYFNVAPNSDSIAPVAAFIKEDIGNFINSFHWQ
jgi:gliding motility-associated lipoprotein GldD